MSREQIIALALAALLVFWILGAYNRLLALRQAVIQAWAKVDEALQQRRRAADALLAGLRVPLAAEQGALDAMQAALTETGAATQRMNAKPLLPAHASAWLAAEAPLAATSSRVFALLEHSAGGEALDEPRAQVAAWREAEARLAFARQLFNETARSYDEAIALFPTRLLAPAFGFDAAGRI
ncbi:MAG: LemA family protein [Burkholderiales bacterium]|nr:LemA family protein [Burkholderiales bacterium]MDE1929453.1 LemA family protein [Burkholderiales bacterium]MDE2160579.1 LemA family protein [Burkholderiales bacterium]MDE2503929.1 LemA family protein [Burkholderiales bacterium]